MATATDKITNAMKERALRGGRSATEWMTNVIRTTVSHRAPKARLVAERGIALAPGKVGLRKTRRSEGSPEGSPPYMRTGDGMRSIDCNVFIRGTDLVMQIGVDASAPGGMKRPPSYMFGHERGIRGVVRPWLVSTWKSNRPTFLSMLLAGVRG